MVPYCPLFGRIEKMINFKASPFTFSKGDMSVDFTKKITCNCCHYTVQNRPYSRRNLHNRTRYSG